MPWYKILALERERTASFWNQLWAACHKKSQIYETGAAGRERGLFKYQPPEKMGALVEVRLNISVHAGVFLRKRAGKQNKEISGVGGLRSLRVSQHSPFRWLSQNCSRGGAVFLVESQQVPRKSSCWTQPPSPKLVSGTLTQVYILCMGCILVNNSSFIKKHF